MGGCGYVGGTMRVGGAMWVGVGKTDGQCGQGSRRVAPPDEKNIAVYLIWVSNKMRFLVGVGR